MADMPVAVQFDEVLERYFDSVLQSIPADPLYIERRLISDEKWQKYVGEGSFRYSGLLREYEPDLPKLLANRRLVIVGEPGAGKSTVARAVVRQFAASRTRSDVPIFLRLRGYAGDLGRSLAGSVPNEVLTSRAISRRYIFDGLDEIPAELLSTATTQINRLLADDANCGIILTARQAFYADHARELSLHLAAFHLLDFDEEDLREFARQSGLDPQKFIDDIHEARLYEEVRNPFNAAITIERLRAEGHLSQLRSENVAWVVERMLATRPVLEPMRQRRAVQLLGVGMETYCRNELTTDEATRILTLGLDVAEDRAGEILDQLHHSILIRTSTGVAFQLRSYGELLASEALQSQSLDRVRELAFFQDGSPNPSWMNTISFLVEHHAAVRRFFIANYPEWVLEASPEAFSTEERTAVADNIITHLDNNSQFILYHPTIKARRLYRFVTPRTMERLLRDLDSSRAEVKANAMVILGMAGRVEVVEAALPIALDTRRSDTVRYSAIIAVMNGGSHEYVDRILTVLDRTDRFYEVLIECAAVLVAPAELSKVLPHILGTNTMLSAVFNRFGELRDQEAVLSLLDYLAAHPDVLDSIRAEGYLNPIIRAIPNHWNDEVAAAVTRVLIGVETARIFGQGRLKRELVQAVTNSDAHRRVCSALLNHFIERRSTPIVTVREIAAWMTPAHVDQLVEAGATDLIRRLSMYLAPGIVRERLAPHAGGIIQAQDQNAEEIRAQEALLEQERTNRLSAKQELARTGDFEQVLAAFHGLEEETWPDLDGARREWLAGQVSRWLTENDMNRAIVRHGDNSWTQPIFLETVLKILDRYDLRIEADVQLVLTLRAWPYPSVGNYFRRHGFSAAAQREIVTLITDRTQHRDVLAHALGFVEISQFTWPSEAADLLSVVNDRQIEAQDQLRAAQILIAGGVGDVELKALLVSSNRGIREAAFDALVDRQDRETISRALSRLRGDSVALRAAEVSPLDGSPESWILKIHADWAWDDLREIRRLTLEQRLPYFCEKVTRTLYAINPRNTVELIRGQLRFAPEEWRPRQTTLVAEYERARQFDEARNTPFDSVLEKLKTSTSLIALKVWIEGKTDLPVYKKLLCEAGHNELADSLDVVGGWPMLSSRPPHRWIDGCREAVIIMDGDVGRRLDKQRKPYTAVAENAFTAFLGLPITLFVLERYGIENYFTQAALEAVIGRDLSGFMPIPDAVAIEDHLLENKSALHRLAESVMPRLIKTFRGERPSFYRKDLNAKVAQHLTNADVANSDLGETLRQVTARYTRIRTA